MNRSMFLAENNRTDSNVGQTRKFGKSGKPRAGGYSVYFWVGVCREDSETLILYQTMFS